MKFIKLLTGLDLNNNSGYLTSFLVLFIFCVFVLFLWNLDRSIRNLKNKISYINRESTEIDFENTLGTLWKDYKATFIAYPFGEKTQSLASIYFNSANLLSNSMGLPILTSASNILVGLGVLGTFLGLTVGISGFDTSTSDTIKGSIQDLLAGMGSAFLTSVWGMFFSLIMTLVEKYQIGKLQIKIQNLCYEIDYKYHFNAKDAQILREIEMNNMFERYFIYTDENNNTVTIPKLLHDNYMVTDKMCGAVQSFSTDLACKIEAGFESIINSDSLNEILPSLHAVKAEIVKLNSDFKNPISEMMESVISELKNAMTSMLKDMRESMTETTNKDLKNVSQLLASSSEALLDLPITLSRMTSELELSFEGIKTNILETTDAAANQNKQGIINAQELMINTTENMSKQFDQITSNLSGYFDNIGKKMEEISSRTSIHNQTTIEHLQAMLTQTTESTQQQLKDSQDKQIEINTQQLEAIKTVQNLLKQFQYSIEKLTEVNSEVGSTINETSKLQNDVSKSCNTLAQFSDVIRRSSDNFVMTQEQFKNFSNNFITENMQLVDKLQTLVKESIEGANINIHHYTGINQGIEGIFEKIQIGLQQYQKTVDDGVKSSLLQYTEALTQVAENLSGASSAQQELLEEISETITKIKK